jgi:NADH dehydrogenase
VAVSLPETLPDVRLILGEADRIDLDSRRVGWIDAEGGRGACGYDRLVLAVGSVNKLLRIPGVNEHAHGFRGISEALFLRDHMTRQIELADLTDDAAERAARTTFVVVGAGYTGTEVAAQGVLYTDVLHARHPRLRARARWLLLDLAERVLPELDPRLSATAHAVLRERGVDVRTGVSVREATPEGVHVGGHHGRFTADALDHPKRLRAVADIGQNQPCTAVSASDPDDLGAGVEPSCLSSRSTSLWKSVS